jgi:hypothetical protein
MMSVFCVIAGGVLVALGLLEGAHAVLPLAPENSRLRWLRTGPGQRRLVAAALLDLLAGPLLITGGITNGLAVALILLSSAVVDRLLRSDLKSWLRSRRERKLASAAAGHGAVLTDLENSRFARRLTTAAEGWEALRDRRENLDRRVASGEITADTRDRYMKAHRRQLIQQLGYNWPFRWPERFLVSMFLPLLDAQARRLRAELTERS